MKRGLWEWGRDLTPPLLQRAWRRWRQAGTVATWEVIPEGWAYAARHPEVRGWDDASILHTQLLKWPDFQRLTQGKGPLGIAHEAPRLSREEVAHQNTVLAFGYVAALAAQGRTRLSLLDWGGGIGHYYVLARALLPDIPIDYECRDQPLLVAQGANLFPEQRFLLATQPLEGCHDLVLASSSLHYSEDWHRTLADLARVTGDYLFITRLPTVSTADSYVFIQRPYAYGYRTEYLGWCLNREEFLAAVGSQDFELVREFILSERPDIRNAPEPCRCRGFLFRRPVP